MNKPGRKKNKNLSYFSHEYIIANHGDIVSFVVMIMIMGLMFKLTIPLASMFIAMQHNVTVNSTAGNQLNWYGSGRLDWLAIIFYTLVTIVIHAVIQEYVLDKYNRKFHLSKIKHAKFNESGQLAVFFIVSVIWAANIIYSEKLITSLSSLWEGYPHIGLPFWGKVFFIIQISYWVHNYPELYFQKIKKEDMAPIIVYSSIYLFAITAAYFLNFTYLALILLLAHYTVEAFFHVSRLLFFMGSNGISQITFLIWKVLYVLTRVGSVTLAFLVFFRGLEKTSIDHINPAEGNFNTRLVRLNCFTLVLLIQVYMMWNFINFHLRRYREKNASKKTTYVTNADLNVAKARNKAKRGDGDTSDGHDTDSRPKKKAN